MKYAILFSLLALTACATAPSSAPYPTSYTGGPPPVIHGHVAEKTEKPCCDKDAKPAGKKHTCPPDAMKKHKHADHSAHADHDAHAGHDSKPTDIYAGVMNDMHKAMGDYTPTGDADTDFMLGMIPHHQGAVDMALLVLDHGDDPYVRRLARDVIVAQRREIAFMQYWLRTRGQMQDSNISNVNVDE